MKMPSIAGKCALGISLLVSATSALATPTATSVRGDIGTDFVNWGSVGDPFDYLGTIFGATSVGGVSMTVTGSSSSFIRVDESENDFDHIDYTGWKGNFSLGDKLLYTDWQPATIDIAFASAVYGAGAQIQSDLPGLFTATLSAYGENALLLATHDFSGSSSIGPAGTAIFAGFISTDAEIKRLVISVDDGVGYLGFAINDLQVSGQAAGVPDGRVYFEFVMLAMLGVSALAHRRRRAAGV